MSFSEKLINLLEKQYCASIFVGFIELIAIITILSFITKYKVAKACFDGALFENWRRKIISMKTDLRNEWFWNTHKIRWKEELWRRYHVSFWTSCNHYWFFICPERQDWNPFFRIPYIQFPYFALRHLYRCILILFKAWNLLFFRHDERYNLPCRIVSIFLFLFTRSS